MNYEQLLASHNRLLAACRTVQERFNAWMNSDNGNPHKKDDQSLDSQEIIHACHDAVIPAIAAVPTEQPSTLPIPTELWLLWNEPDADDRRPDYTGNWVIAIDGVDNDDLLAYATEQAAATAADHQNDCYDLNCRPIRVK